MVSMMMKTVQNYRHNRTFAPKNTYGFGFGLGIADSNPNPAQEIQPKPKPRENFWLQMSEHNCRILLLNNKLLFKSFCFCFKLFYPFFFEILKFKIANSLNFNTEKFRSRARLLGHIN